MIEPPKRFHDGKRGAALSIRVTPRSSRNELIGILDDGTIKIKITGAPVDGKANQVLIKFISELFGVPVTCIAIVAGKSGKNKIIAIEGLDAGEIDQKIEKILNSRK